MAEFPEELRYASSHEWARIEDDGTVTVGISDHAQEELGDVVFVELPELATELEARDEAGVIESVKAASDVYAPVSGKVIAVNDQLEEAPETVNESPFDKGWFFKLEPRDKSEMNQLLDANEYQQLCESQEH